MRILRTFIKHYALQNNILILTYWSFSDALIQAYTLPYVRIISKQLSSSSSIFLVTLEKDNSHLSVRSKNEIKDALKKEGIVWLPFSYKPFGVSAFFLWLKISTILIRIIILNKISTIHSWCTPAGAIGYFLAVTLRRKLILDSFEPHAELMVENGTWSRNGAAFKLLFWLERKQSERANVAILVTEGMRGYALKKYMKLPSKIFVKPACVDIEKFKPAMRKDPFLLKELQLTDKVVCVYAGKFGGIYLMSEVFDFFKAAHQHWGSKFAVLLLTSHTVDDIKKYCQQSSLDFSVVSIRFVPHNEVPVYMGLGDFAINPMKPIPTRRFSAPIKDGEYWAMGLPVVIPKDISDDSEIIEKYNAGAVLDDLSLPSYQKAIKKIDLLLAEHGEQLSDRIRSLAVRYRNFSIAEDIYKKIYQKD